jgi:hypothetical protein
VTADPAFAAYAITLLTGVQTIRVAKGLRPCPMLAGEPLALAVFSSRSTNR